jgi:hypothetical protein
MNSRMTLRERVLIYFGRNPDEELTSRDIAEKFNARDVREAGRALRYAVEQGLLCREWQTRQLAVYSAGPVLLREVGAEQEKANPATAVTVPGSITNQHRSADR